MKVLSLGAGVQSSTLLLMAIREELERPDFVIFADTCDEPMEVYKHLEFLKEAALEAAIPILTVSRGKLSDSILRKGQRFIAIPTFGSRGGIGRRQCTREFKIDPINRKIRELLGAKPRQRIAVGSVDLWIGISLDEVMRMKPNRALWIKNRWPLIEKRMTRHDCLLWLKKNGYPIPSKSACIFCPFHDNATWRKMKNEMPEEFRSAVELDAQLNARGEFLHRSLRPLGEIDFRNAEDMGQASFINECEGFCGV